MRLCGASLTRPICDWRPILDRDARLKYISPALSIPSKTYIKGFGVCHLRSKPRILGRDMELKYFDCSRAIQLPTRLPGEIPVDQRVTRLYLDDDPCGRFEFSVFAKLHARGSSSHRPDQLARAFWNSKIQLTLKNAKMGIPIWRGLNELTDYFLSMTSTYELTPSELIEDGEPMKLIEGLDPQLLMLLEAEPSEMPAAEIDRAAKLRLAHQPLWLEGWATPVDTLYLIQLPKYFKMPPGTELDRHRMVRAHLGSLYGDLRILAHMLDAIANGVIDGDAVYSSVLKLWKSLRQAPDPNDLEYETISRLRNAFLTFHANRVRAIVNKFDSLDSIPSDVRAEAHTLLQSLNQQQHPITVDQNAG